MLDAYITQIKESALYVANLERSHHFYHELLGFAIVARKEGRHIFYKVGNTVLLCFLAEATARDTVLPPHFGSGQLHLAFEVPSSQYAEVKQQVEAAGITIEHVQKWSPGVESFYFRDPDQHSLEIIPAGMWGM